MCFVASCVRLVMPCRWASTWWLETTKTEMPGKNRSPIMTCLDLLVSKLIRRRSGCWQNHQDSGKPFAVSWCRNPDSRSARLNAYIANHEHSMFSFTLGFAPIQRANISTSLSVARITATAQPPQKYICFAPYK